MKHLGKNIVLKEVIGQGGMGTVYEGFLLGASNFKKRVAIKIPNAEFSKSSDFREAFRRECEVMSKLTHPNIAHIYQVGEHEKTPYMVIEFIEGITLKTNLEIASDLKELLPLGYVIFIISNIARAIEYAHTQNIVHRDLSPHNIMIDNHGTVKVLDFGISKILDQSDQATKSNLFQGKIGYFSPEILLGQKTSQRSDIFSLGIIFHELLYGLGLFKGQSDFETINNVKEALLPDTTGQRPEVSAVLKKLVRSCLQKDAKKRPSSCQEILERLSREKSFTPEEATKYLADQKKRYALLPKNTDKTVKDSVPYPRRKRTLLSGLRERRNAFTAATFVLIILSVGSWLIFSKTNLSQKQTQLESGPKITWYKGNEKIDLSPPKLDYKEIIPGNPNQLQNLPCLAFINAILLQTSMASDKSLAENEKALTEKFKINTTPQAYVKALRKSLVDGSDEILRQLRVCSENSEYPAAAEAVKEAKRTYMRKEFDNITSYDQLTEVVNKISPKLKEFYLRANEEGRFGVATRAEANFRLAVIAFNTSAASGYDVINLSNKVPIVSSLDCALVGDLLFIHDLENDLAQGKRIPNEKAYLVAPQGTNFLIRGIKDGALVVAAKDDYSDIVFKRGVCFYKRTSERLVTSHFWIPRPELTNNGRLPATIATNKGAESTGMANTCCKVCKTGRACGDTCIPLDKICHKATGCACDAPK